MSPRECTTLHSHLIESGVLSGSEESEARNALAASCTAFSDGFKTLNDHASLTPLGRRVMECRPQLHDLDKSGVRL